MFAAAVMAVSASAQTTQESKFFDNWYLGVNVGAATKTTHNAWFKNVNPSVGVRLGKWFTPVWGAAVEADLYARNRNLPYTHKTLVRGASGKFIGTINATNLFLGYKGEPRKFEIIPLAGIGAYHSFNLHNGNLNALTANVGVDFAFNLGANKAWQVYVEPVSYTHLDVYKRQVVTKPIKFIGTGEKMDAIDVFHPARMADRILGMGDVVSLVERAQEQFDLEEAKKLEKKIRKNQFDFNDFYNQIQQIKKMGNIKDLAAMIPGVGKAIRDVDIPELSLIHI